MSSRLNIPKAIITTPPKADINDDSYSLKCCRQFEVVTINAESGLQEMHQARIKILRKKLDYIKDTNWKFSSSDI